MGRGARRACGRGGVYEEGVRRGRGGGAEEDHPEEEERRGPSAARAPGALVGVGRHAPSYNRPARRDQGRDRGQGRDTLKLRREARG